jgi:hypothetical protein
MKREELIAELRSSHLHMYDGSRDGHGMKVFRLCTEAADTITALDAALRRQADNMAFVINHATLYAWADKFSRELEEDRLALRDKQP